MYIGYPLNIDNVKAFLPILFLLLPLLGTSQEFDSDLFTALNYSSLKLFKNSEMNKLKVTTYRKSNDAGSNVVETVSTYRKGRINPERINFNVKYTEHYAVEDRKKSLGKYEFKDGKLFKYERTDFNSRNARMYTLYSNFNYENDIVLKENMRTKEYVASGSVDFDTVVVKDTIIYEVSESTGGFRQDNLSDPGSYTVYQIADGQLMSKTSYFEVFSEKTTYTYDSKGHLVKIMTVLSNDEGGSSTTRTELHYSMDGLLDETKFYDDTGDLLERKIFEYK